MGSSSKLGQCIPPPLRPAAKTVYYKIFRLFLRLRFWWSDRFGAALAGVPIPPAVLRYRVSELLSAREFLRSGESCAALIQRSAKERGVHFDGSKRVLDFGCGCGRVTTWMLRDCDAEFHAVDVDAEAVEWCRKSLSRGHFLPNLADPPLSFPDHYFDIVYCLSVFTHLNESMQDLWFSELSRVLKPSGLLLFTVFGAATRDLLSPTEEGQFSARGFVHKRSEKLRGLVPDWYHTTWQSKEYLVGRLSARFENIQYSVVPDSIQDVVSGFKSASTQEPTALRRVPLNRTTVRPGRE